ncbi:DUF5068 domain-containing protein [Listeria booriae]|uniref:DUF5068 domain-containing protein n=1 Tax=Listeria booriae TaxID=1552123 RepID=A0A7X0YN07_9LIST|nr:DUF5068 domain-containing protein [Listeria booriae]MBC2117365.1 DUF5068 domain-containing protein [Listeria booriae]MBC2326148.1 DUF5068 domain-containing protein [Listeria booriae]
MKKLLMVGMMSAMLVGLAACGSDADSKSAESDKATPKTEEKEVAKKAETTKQDVNSDTDANKQTEEKQDKESTTAKEDTPTTEKAEEKTSEPAAQNDTTKETTDTAKTEEKTPEQKQAATAGAFSLTPAGFKQSAVAPKTGGTVSLVYLNTTPETADFGPLKVTVKQYKLESVAGANKKMDPYSPESYLANQDGFVVTADVVIENTSASNINYLAERIQINGGGISKGASLENFVPTAYQLSGSATSHNIFPAKSKREGAITYMLNKDNYYTLVHLTKLVVPNPNDFADKALPVKTTKAIDLDFRITE